MILTSFSIGKLLSASTPAAAINPPRSRSAIWITLLFFVIAALRITAVSDLHEGDQPKQADYVLDIVCNGNWTVQHHADGSIMSKPPLYNWLAAPLVMLFGAEDVWLKMPSLLAGLAAALMTWDLARRKLGDRAALWGSVFMLLTSMFDKQMYYARTDMLLTCFIVMQFWAIERLDAHETENPRRQGASYRSGWIWIFWIAAALGNLTKGPLALLPHLALSALWLYEGRFKERYARLGLWWGLPLAFAPLLIWFACAYRAEGYAVYEHMVKAEVVARFQSEVDRAGLKGTDKSNRSPFYYIPLLLARTAPWSLFALLGIWGVVVAKKNTELSERERSMLYFLAAWFLTTFLFFSAVPSKRADRVFPAIPAFCLLAGWAFDGLLKSMEGKGAKRIEYRIAGWIVFVIAVVFIVAGHYEANLHFGVNFNAIKKDRFISTVIMEHLLTMPVLGVSAGVLVLAGGLITLVAYFKKRPAMMTMGLFVSELALTVIYQLVFGSWLFTDFSRGAPQVCRVVRKKAHDEHLPILIISGSGPAARFYLLQPGLETSPKDAAARLALPHPALIVVGTRPSTGAKQRLSGGLEQAGLADATPLTIAGLSYADELDPKRPTIPMLAAVVVPERK